MYSSGDNTYGQLGVGRAWPGADDADGAAAGGRVHFVKRVWPAPPASLAAGHYHSALVDLGGRLYTWGCVSGEGGSERRFPLIRNKKSRF